MDLWTGLPLLSIVKDFSEQKKTMMLINPNNEYPGVLSSILNVFSALGINLTWIESRPTGKRLGSYRFLIESEAAQNDQRMVKAIKILETFEHQVHLVGSYSTTVLQWFIDNEGSNGRYAETASEIEAWLHENG